MDGVLADFEQYHVDVMGHACDWNADGWKYDERFKFIDIPPMPDMDTLWSYVEQYDPIVLTGLPSTEPERAWGEKRRWLDKHLGARVPMIGCKSVDKCRYSRWGDVLIDDREPYSKHWTQVGGVWITHTSAASSIEQLKQIGL
jgi:hypothetical protein